MRHARHALALIVFALLAIAWTWPLVRHLHDAVPGDPGDNYSFMWNLWWMRKVLATPGLSYFHTRFLFYPFGASIANHPQTALPAFVAATLFRRLSLVTAQNVLLLSYVFLNLTGMYAFAWDVTRKQLPSMVAAIVFGLSPFLSVHLLGHFDLVAAWPIPLFALALRRAIGTPSTRAAAAAGLVLAATAYIAYYYVVFLVIASPVYAAASGRMVHITTRRRALPRGITVLCAGLAAAAFVIGIEIALTGGRSWQLGSVTVDARSPQNALSMMWLVLVLWALAAWRPRLAIDFRSPSARSAIKIIAWIAGVFALAALPLEWEALRLVARHEYVSQQYGWKSIPHGVDVIAPFLGHPLHPLVGAVSRRAYDWLGQNFVEAIGWIGIATPAVLLATRRSRPDDDDWRGWRAVGLVFAVWCAGPFLTVLGVDIGLKLPAILLRFLPVVANARMPGRAIVIVFLAMALAIAHGLSRTSGRLRSPAFQSVLMALIAFEYWGAPIRLTPIDASQIYRVLAAEPEGAVCEVPFGIGDGLSAGMGSQDRKILFYATQHGHPLAGGYIGRMPADAAAQYASMPIVGSLLRLSSNGGAAGERPVDPHDEPPSASPCRYLVVDRMASSAALLEYVASLHARQIASADGRELLGLW